MNLATAFVEIRTDASQGKAEARKAIADMVAQDAVVKLDADATKAQAVAKKLVADIDGTDATVKVGLDDQASTPARALDDRLSTVAGKDRTILMRAEIAQAEAQIRKIDQALQDPTLDNKQIHLLIDERNVAAKKIEDIKSGLGELPAAAEKSADGVTKQFARIFGAAVFAKGIKESIDLASDFNETVSKTGVIFGSAGAAIIDFAQNSAKQFGLSKTAALDALSTFATFGKGAGLTGNDLAGFSEKLVGLSADLASFYNTSPADAVTAIGAALRGESEPIRQYGVLLDDATLKARALSLGIYDGTGVLDQHSKVLAAQAEILAQTSDAQGDFIRTSDGLANSQRIAKAQAEDSAASLGQNFLPIYQRVVTIVGAAAEAFGNLPAPVQTAVVALAGFVALSGPIKSTIEVGNSLVKMITNLGTKSAGLVGGIGNLGVALGAVGALVAAGVFLYDRYSAAKERARVLTEGFTKALEAEKAGQQDALAATIAANLAQSGAAELAAKYGLSATDLANVIMGKSVPAWDALSSQIEYHGRGAGDAQIDIGNLREAIGLQATALGTAKDAFAKNSAEQELAIAITKDLTAETKKASGVTDEYGGRQQWLADQLEHRGLAGQEAAKSDEAVAAAAKESKDAVDALKASVDDSTTSYDRLASAASTLKSAIDAVFGGTLSMEEANRAYNDGVAKVAQSLKDNGKSLDITTEKGRANRTAIEDQVKAILDFGVAAAGSGDSNEEAAGKVAYLTQGLRDQLSAAKLTDAQIDTYLATLGLTPENVTTTIAVANDEATKARIKPLLDQLEKVDAGAVAEVDALVKRDEFDEAERRLNELLRLATAVGQAMPNALNNATANKRDESQRTRGSTTATPSTFTGDAVASPAQLAAVATALTAVTGLTSKLAAADLEVAAAEDAVTRARQGGQSAAAKTAADRLAAAKLAQGLADITGDTAGYATATRDVADAEAAVAAAAGGSSSAVQQAAQDRLTAAQQNRQTIDKEIADEDQRVGAMYRAGELSGQAYYDYIKGRSAADVQYTVEWEAHQNLLQDIIDTAVKERDDKTAAATKKAADDLAAAQKAEEDSVRAQLARLAAIYAQARADQTLAETTAQAEKDYTAYDQAGVRNYLTSINPKATAAERSDAANAYQAAQDAFAKTLLARARATAIQGGQADGTQGFADSVRAALEQDKRNAPNLTNEIDTLLLGIPNFNGASSTGFGGVSAAAKAGGLRTDSAGGVTFPGLTVNGSDAMRALVERRLTELANEILRGKY